VDHPFPRLEVDADERTRLFFAGALGLLELTVCDNCRQAEDCGLRREETRR
jgi:hypothetical protein